MRSQGEHLLPGTHRGVVLSELFTQLCRAPQQLQLLRVIVEFVCGRLVDLCQVVEGVGLPGQPFEFRLNQVAIEPVGERLERIHERGLRLPQIALENRANLVGQLRPLCRRSRSLESRLAQLDALLMISCSPEHRVENGHGLAAVSGFTARPRFERIAGGLMLRVIGEHLPKHLQRSMGIVEGATTHLPQAIRNLTALGALPFLIAAEFERELQIGRPFELSVQAVESGRGIAGQRIARGNLTPIRSRTFRIMQPLFTQLRRITLDYHRPARIDDLLHVRTRYTVMAGARPEYFPVILALANNSGSTPEDENKRRFGGYLMFCGMAALVITPVNRLLPDAILVQYMSLISAAAILLFPLAGMGADWLGGFLCPCHGSTFDFAGRVYKAKPAPDNLEVPPHYYIADGRILIGEDKKGA